ncbi:hypothetical protein B0H17DRAFT_1215035 [Mycena rosella]|uniref:Uncharacterized protein n=1 Tax=Mycena rosella TaxID=1033263 RepID=A0AAD7CLR2_MYCRO|nr:hypothetical protein B0H17DRAFT_1215035 [Mycena rosella]
MHVVVLSPPPSQAYIPTPPPRRPCTPQAPLTLAPLLDLPITRLSGLQMAMPAPLLVLVLVRELHLERPRPALHPPPAARPGSASARSIPAAGVRLLRLFLLRPTTDRAWTGPRRHRLLAARRPRVHEHAQARRVTDGRSTTTPRARRTPTTRSVRPPPIHTHKYNGHHPIDARVTPPRIVRACWRSRQGSAGVDFAPVPAALKGNGERDGEGNGKGAWAPELKAHRLTTFCLSGGIEGGG